MIEAIACPEAVEKASAKLVSVTATNYGCLVTMPCLFPSGARVQLNVDMRNGGYFISDDGKALREIRSSGMDHASPGRYIAAAGRGHGVKYGNGILFLENVSEDLLQTAFTLVASSAQEAVVRALESFTFPNPRNFRYAFDSFIRDSLPDKFKQEMVAGKRRVHTLDYVYRGAKLIIADPAQKNKAVINGLFTIHSDIASSLAKISKLISSQIIVYDEQDEWKKSDLELLMDSGAELMEYTFAQTYLPKLVPSNTFRI